jgi:hypothetical protein
LPPISLQSSLAVLPLKIVHIVEMVVASGKRETVLDCNRGDPHVVFRDWPAL